jgi:hypothetical protein
MWEAFVAKHLNPTHDTHTHAHTHTHTYITYASIPWVKKSDLGAMGVKNNYRQLFLKWHPDKFKQKFGHLIQGEGERERIMKEVTKTFQMINSMR